MEKLQPRYKPAEYEVVCLGTVEPGNNVMIFPGGHKSEPFTAQVMQIKRTKQQENPAVRVRRGGRRY